MSEDRTFVARDEDVAALTAFWQQAAAGQLQLVRLRAPFGGGKRALAGEFLRQLQRSDAKEEPIIWRVTCLQEENGLQWLIRMYGSLMAVLTADPLRRGKVEMMLNSQLATQPKRVQGWYESFIGSMKGSKTDQDKGQIQLTLPQDNPLVGLVEVLTGISRRAPVLLELQGIASVNSLLASTFLEALATEGKESRCRLMVLLHEEVDNEVTRASTPYPLIDLFERRAASFQTLDVAAWGPTEIQRFLDSKGLRGDAGALARICSGRPGFVAEVTELLQERGDLDGDLSAVTLSSLVPFQVDEDELDLPEGPPKEGERKHAGPADAPTVAYLAALLGHAFPAGLVADMGGFDRDSVDDLLDAMGDLFEEVQFSQELGTWIYRFKRGSWREGILEQNRTDAGLAQARQVALFIERYLMPRGYGFMPKAMRLYAENGAPNRATLVRAIQLANDAPDAWGLVFDLLRYFDEVTWPDPLRRTVYQHLVERMVSGGNPQMAEQVLNEATEFANRTKDRELSAALLLQGSRLDARRQDLFRARDRANDAIKLFVAQELNARAAEVHNHLAAIELSDGNLNAALEQINQALELGKVKTPEGQEGIAPAVFATATRLRGTIARRAGRLPEAAELFRRANEVAGQAGLASEALDSGLSYGEALLANRQVEPARDALERVFGIARSLNNPARERAAAELLAQAEGQLRNYDKALPLARRVLELSQQLRLDNLLVIDLYNLGFFTFLTQKPTEAVTLFRQAQARLGSLPANHPVHRELHYFFGVALLQTGALDEGIATLRKGVTLLRDANEPVKLASALEHLSNGYLRKGDKQNARAALDQAITVARNAGLKDAKKELKRKLEELDGPAN